MRAPACRWIFFREIAPWRYEAQHRCQIERLICAQLRNPLETKSLGELRWVVLATMIGADSKVLFIDEIELHLSKKDQATLLSILHRKINYDGVTLITSTQNKDLLSRIASVTITLENGRIASVRSAGKKKGRYSGSKRK